MIGALLQKRNSCVTLHPPGSHLSRTMSKPNGSESTMAAASSSATVKRCHSTSKVEGMQRVVPSNLKERINGELQLVAQKICLIESMILCMSSAQEGEELIGQLRETNHKLQQILPALHIFMTMPQPAAKEDKERLQYERKQLSREFEAAISGYKNAHKALHTEIKRLKINVSTSKR